MLTNVTVAAGILRITTGLLVAYHGLEVNDATKMAEYSAWEKIAALPFAAAMAYTGKGIELIAGVLLALGLFARWASAAIMVVMLFICFYLGNGRFWYEDQHPFLLALLTAFFWVVGPGACSVAGFFGGNRRKISGTDNIARS